MKPRPATTPATTTPAGRRLWRLRRAAQATALALATWLAIAPLAPVAQAQDAARLQARYDGLRDDFRRSPFNRPLLLQSTQSANQLNGSVHAVIDQPFATVGPALADAQHWCDLLLLHLNVKACTVGHGGPGTKLRTVVGRKVEQPSGDGYGVELAYDVPASKPDYLQVRMSAEDGPLGTRDYLLELEAAPIDGGRRTFMRLGYAYTYGTMARLAMDGYLHTVGRDKIGFSVAGQRPDGTPAYVQGVRGVIERNTMRYYLAIESFLAAPGKDAQETRLASWFDATEKYARQLHEVSRDDYLQMKRHELQRSASTH